MININNKWYNYDRVTITGTEKNDRVIEYNVWDLEGIRIDFRIQC